VWWYVSAVNSKFGQDESDHGTGFLQAFDTIPQWTYTFFAPSNAAFKNTGEYFTTFAATPKGKWWLGNLIQHHYVPNSLLKSSAFNSSYTRIQTGSFLYIGTQIVASQLMLNNVSTVTSADIPVTSVSIPGLVDLESATEFCRDLCMSSITFWIRQHRYLNRMWRRLARDLLLEAVRIHCCHIARWAILNEILIISEMPSFTIDITCNVFSWCYEAKDNLCRSSLICSI
jgi:hypothetical protein